MKNIIRYSLSLAILGLFCLGCTEYDEYKKYTSGGEIIYPGKADTVIVRPGKNRVALQWVVSDPKVETSLLTWNGNTDSLLVTVKREADLLHDTVEVIIPDLKEGNYTFYIENRDIEGNRSLRTSADGIVYGELYSKTLLNRGLNACLLRMGIATIEWLPADPREIGTVLKYIDKTGKEKTRTILPNEGETQLSDYKESSPMSYCTGYVPDSLAIDTIYANWETIAPPQVVYRVLDKGTFQEYPLPGDIGSAWGWILSYLWDDNINEGRGFHTTDCSLPQQVTFDLGVTTRLSEVTVWQRLSQAYIAGNLKRFEIWGATEPAADGSWDGWQKLGAFESIKPSGLPLGELSPEDVSYAEKGENFSFSPVTPVVRYIRVRFMEQWNPATKYIHLMEITFKGDY